MKKKRLTDLEKIMDKYINDFMNLSVEEFVEDYTNTQFKKLIDIIPPTHSFINTMVSLLYQFEEIEEFEKCQIIYDKLKEFMIEEIE